MSLIRLLLRLGGLEGVEQRIDTLDERMRVGDQSQAT